MTEIVVEIGDKLKGTGCCPQWLAPGEAKRVFPLPLWVCQHRMAIRGRPRIQNAKKDTFPCVGDMHAGST